MTAVSIRIAVLVGVRDALKKGGKPMTAVELWKILGGTESTFWRNLHALEEAGLLECVGLRKVKGRGGPRARLWKWV